MAMMGSISCRTLNFVRRHVPVNRGWLGITFEGRRANKQLLFCRQLHMNCIANQIAIKRWTLPYQNEKKIFPFDFSFGIKKLSTRVESAVASSVMPDGVKIHAEPTIIQPSLVEGPDGRQFAAFEVPQFHRKLKPYIVKRRLGRMRTFVGKQKDIRHSPWRMNLVCKFAAGQTLTDAIQQLTFCRKSMAPLVKKVLIRTANVADMKYGLQHSQLEVAECFATKGKHLKRRMIMGRGRTGRMEHKHSHFRVVLREIDFKLRIYQAPTLGQKKRWFIRQQQAEADYAKAKAERDEISRLEKETEGYRTKDEKK